MANLDRLGAQTHGLHQKVANELEVKGINIPIEGQSGTRIAGEGYQDISTLGYPAEYTRRDPREERLTILRQIGRQWKEDTNAQFALPTNELIDYYITKKEHLEFLEWEKWVQDNYDMRDPAQVKMLKEIMPEYFDRRLDFIKKRLGLIFLMAKIDLLGPASKEDLMILYQVQKGVIDPVNLDDIFNKGTAADDAARKTKFEAGIFNLRPIFGAEGAHKAPGAAPFGVNRAVKDRNAPAFTPWMTTNRNTFYDDIGTRYSGAAGIPGGGGVVQQIVGGGGNPVVGGGGAQVAV